MQCENPQTCVPLGCVLGAPASQRREAATSGATVTGAHPFTVQSIELVVRHFEPKKMHWQWGGFYIFNLVISRTFETHSIQSRCQTNSRRLLQKEQIS